MIMSSRQNVLSARVTLVSLLFLPLSACSLIGLEPDEIDVADGESGGLTGQGATSGEDFGEETGAEAGDGDGDNNDTGPGDGDGDPGDGDGDGDTGDGDGDSDTGDGDGDGDGDPVAPCAELGATPVVLGPNPVDLVDPGTLESDCGHPGPEGVYSFAAPAAGGYEFALIDADFEGALYPLDGECAPVNELCVASPEVLTLDLALGEVVLVVVDSSAGGSGTLDIAALP
jgi:hypothetical protein